jgi:hypothetical protein
LEQLLLLESLPLLRHHTALLHHALLVAMSGEVICARPVYLIMDYL